MPGIAKFDSQGGFPTPSLDTTKARFDMTGSSISLAAAQLGEIALDGSSLTELSLAARVSVTLTSLAFIIVMHRALRRSHARVDLARTGGWGLGMVFATVFLVAAAFAHLEALRATLGTVFPIGFALGLVGAVASLAWPTARDAFDHMSDGDVRILLSFRGVFGAFILALAALGRMPVSFAFTAGLGGLAVAWVALACPTVLDRSGPRMPRFLVHSLGLLDLGQVLALAVLVVRPWSIAHGNVTDVMTLPWLAVPLMVALNAHGIRQASLASQTDEPARNRSESIGGVRGAVSRT